MVFDLSGQNNIIEKAKLLVEEAEVARRQKRLSKGIDAFIAGESKLLANKDFVQDLMMLIQEESERDIPLVEALLRCLSEKNVEIRHRALTLLCFLFDRKDLVFNEKMIADTLVVLALWYKVEDEFFPGLANINKQVNHFCHRLVMSRQYEVVADTFLVLSKIRNGILFKDKHIKTEVSSTLQSFVTKDVLQFLRIQYAENSKDREIISSIFVCLGGKAAAFLLRSLIHCGEQVERLLLTELLSHYGGAVVPLLIDCLAKNPPWFVVRNVLTVFGNMDDSSFYSDIKHYATYNDIRVQQEFVKAVVNMGGVHVDERLVEILPKVDEKLQIRLVHRLGNQENGDVVAYLCDFLESNLHVLLRREDVLIALTIALQKNPSDRALFLLRTLLEECLVQPQLVRLGNAVKEALSVTGPILRHKTRQKVDGADVSYLNDPEEHEKAVVVLREIKNEIEYRFATGGEDDLSTFLYEKGISYSQEGQYLAATMILEELMYSCPDALERVSALEEYIEKRRDSIVSKFDVFSKLLTPHFTETEISELISCMSVEEYRVGEYIVKKGETDFTMYFILKGRVQLQWENGTRNTFLKRFKSGTCFGQQQFLNASHWTVNALAAADSTVAVLAYQDYQLLKERITTIEEKMVEFCASGYIVSSLIKMSGEDRRRFPRFPSSSPVNIRVLDLYGKQISRSLKGQLLDVSECGLSLLVRLASPDLRRNFLGRLMLVALLFRDGSSLECRGRVVNARLVDAQDQKYSLHLDLSQPLPPNELRRLVDI